MYLLEQMRDPILKKVAQHDQGDHYCSIANLSDLMFCYSAVANVTEKRQFIYDIEAASISKLIMKDFFNTIDSTKLLWGLAKFVNRSLNPYFNNDPASLILNRASLCTVRSVQHRIPALVVEEVLKNRKK